MDLLYMSGLLLTGALLIRLWREGLHVLYQAFYGALCFEFLAASALYFLPRHSNAYFGLYAAAAAGGWIFRYFVLRELCLLVFHDHPGIKSAVVIGIRVSAVLAILLPVLSLALARLNRSELTLLDQFFLFHQSAALFITVLFAGTAAFLTWFPIALRRNIVLFCLGFSLKFVTESLAFLSRNAISSERWRGYANAAEMAVGIGVAALWLGWVNRVGEMPLVSVAQALGPSHVGPALRHLDGLNRFLSDVLPKKTEHK